MNPRENRLTVNPVSDRVLDHGTPPDRRWIQSLALTGRIGAGTSLHSEMARESFLRDLASYRQRKSHAITVVSDGWQQGWGTEQREHRLGLEIIFSRRGEKADQVIQRLAAELGSACAVVSSDREIINVAKVQGAFVMKAQEFIESCRGRRAWPALLSTKSWIQERISCRSEARRSAEIRESCPRRYDSATGSSSDFEQAFCILGRHASDSLDRHARCIGVKFR